MLVKSPDVVENSAAAKQTAAAKQQSANEPAAKGAAPNSGGAKAAVSGSKKTAPPIEPKRVKKQIDKFPRWRKLDRYRKAMIDEKKIWVVAKTRDSDVEKFDEELYIAGAGITSAKPGKAYEELIKFSSWTSLSDYVVASDYNEEKKQLYLHLAAYGYFAKMHLDVAFGEDPQKQDLYMKVVRGHFLGMTVGFRIHKDARSRKSEILMT
ncbi:MAG: hypothetical protein AAF202_04930, partial [Pseudomonadota bacterium]